MWGQKKDVATDPEREKANEKEAVRKLREEVEEMKKADAAKKKEGKS